VLLRYKPFAPGAFTTPTALAALLAASACGRPAATTGTTRGDTITALADAPLTDSALIEGIASSDPLPPLRLPDLNGVVHDLFAPGDDVTVVNFWATWCAPCLAEIPQLIAFRDRWTSKRVRVVGVAVASGSPADIRRFAARHQMAYDLLLMEEGEARRYLSRLHLRDALPISLVVDRHGVIQWKFFGPHTEPQFARAARRAL
jgi:thiol-disulfide isomerase/thioredoxin